MSSLFRIITEIWRSVKFELLSTFGTLLTIILAMILPALVWTASKNLSRTELELKKSLSINVFLRNELSSVDMVRLSAEFMRLNGVTGASYISKEAALERMRQKFGAEMLQGLDENPLPASFILNVDQTVFRPGEAEFLIKKLSGFPEVDDVVFAMDILNKLRRILKSMELLALGLSILVGFAAIFIVANTVRVAISDRKKTVEIMQLVGATRTYILAPFVWLGGLLGLSGAVFSLLAANWITGYVSNHLTKIIFLEPHEIVAFILTGLLLGMLGAIFATRRYLKI
jgi:cell division transport system permease protein